VTSPEEKGSLVFLDLLVKLFLMQPRMLLVAFVAKAYCRLMVNLLS